MNPSVLSPAKYFERERAKFTQVWEASTGISRAVGLRVADERRGWASWLFMRACVTGRTITGLASISGNEADKEIYLDNASLASLARNLIDNVTALLYVGDRNASEQEWRCRKWIIDLHDCTERSKFFHLQGDAKRAQEFDDQLPELRRRLESNEVFQKLENKPRKKLLAGRDMYIHGRSAAAENLGWDEKYLKALYKYFSMQTHSLPMSFHRTWLNRIYADDSSYARGVAGLALDCASRCLGVAAVRLVELFPDVEHGLRAEVMWLRASIEQCGLSGIGGHEAITDFGGGVRHELLKND